MNIAIDLDNTLIDMDTCEWLEGAQEFVSSCLETGLAVIIHTCRTNWKEGGGLTRVHEVLQKAGFTAELVTDSWSFQGGKLGIWVGEGKPVAMAYIDDRAIPFMGDWQQVTRILNEVLS